MITLISVILSSVAITTTELCAQSFAIGYKKYTQGDFKGAEASLKGALLNRQRAADKASTYKFLGIVQYMQGKQSEARRSFAAGLRINPNMQISANEVLDESVISVFNSLKGGGRTVSRTARASRPAVRATNTQKLKSTSILVKSNVPSANVLIDGILAGRVNTPLESKPGPISFQVTASGYRSRLINTSVVANRENTFTVNLEKPKPKVVARPQRRQQQQRQQQQAAPPVTSDLFGDAAPVDTSGRDILGEFSVEGQYGGQVVATPQQQYPTPVPNPYSLQQQLPAPVYPPAPAANPYNPYYNPYGYQQPMYQQPYVAPAPVYQPPVTVYQPPVAATPIAPPSIPSATAANPIPAAPQIDTSVDYYHDDAWSDGGFGSSKKVKKKKSSPRLSYYGGSSTKTKRRTVSSGKLTGMQIFTSLLPFGVGQFYNGRYIVGGLLGAAEAGALIWWYMKTADADKTMAEWEAMTTSQQEAAVAEYQPFVKSLRDQANYGLYGFAGLWGAGAIESMINRPARRVASSSRRRYASIDDVEGEKVGMYALYDEDDSESEPLLNTIDDTDELDSEVIISDFENGQQSNLDVKFGLFLDPNSEKKTPAYGVNINYEF